jgi:hypothetical protein
MGILCGKIAADNKLNCAEPLQGGTENEMIVLNKADIAAKVVNADGLTIEGLTLNSGAQGFVIDGLRNSIAPSCTPVEVSVFDRYEHSVNTKGFDISNTARAALDGQTGGEYVALVKNVYAGTNGNAKYLIYGLDSGMNVKIARNPNDDSQGAFDITYATNLNKEPHLPRALFITDEATTEAVWESLKVLVP